MVMVIGLTNLNEINFKIVNLNNLNLKVEVN